MKRDLRLAVLTAAIVAPGAGCGRAPVAPAPQRDVARSFAASIPTPSHPQAPPKPQDTVRLLDAGAEPRAPLRYSFHPGESQRFRVTGPWSLSDYRKQSSFTQRECNGVIETLQVAADASARQRGSFTTCRYSPLDVQPSAEQLVAARRFDGLRFEDVFSARGELLSFRFLGDAPAELVNEAHDMLSETLVLLPAEPVGDGGRWEIMVGYWQPEQGISTFGVATLLTHSGARFTLTTSTADLEKSPAAPATARHSRGYHEVQLDPPMIRGERKVSGNSATVPQGADWLGYAHSVRGALGGKLGATSEQDTDNGLIVRDGAPGDTRGTITCGLARCKAPQQACVWEYRLGYRCVARDNRGAPSGTFFCDDASDCPSGTTCCQSFASAEQVYDCVARNGDCAAEVCELGGAMCPKGQVCSDGYCAAPAKPSTCQNGQTCPKAQPVCLWRGASGRCVDEPAALAAYRVLENDADNAEGVHDCLLPRDCGSGEHCCTSMSEGTAVTQCRANCDLINSMQACASNADCREVTSVKCGDIRGCRVRCVPPLGGSSGKTPTWFKTCQVVE